MYGGYIREGNEIRAAKKVKNETCTKGVREEKS